MLRHPCTGNICFSFAIQVFSSVYCKNYTRHGCERLGDYVAQVGRDGGDVRGGGAGGDPPPPPGQRGGVPGGRGSTHSPSRGCHAHIYPALQLFGLCDIPS